MVLAINPKQCFANTEKKRFELIMALHPTKSIRRNNSKKKIREKMLMWANKECFISIEIKMRKTRKKEIQTAKVFKSIKPFFEIVGREENKAAIKRTYIICIFLSFFLFYNFHFFSFCYRILESWHIHTAFYLKYHVSCERYSFSVFFCFFSQLQRFTLVQNKLWIFFLASIVVVVFFLLFFHFHSIEFEFYLLRKINGFVSVSVYPYNVFISMLLYISLCFVTIYRRLLLQSSFFCCFFCFQSQSLLILIRARIGNVIMR